MSGLDELARDLHRAAKEAREAARKVVKRGAVNVKRDWRSNATRSAGRHARRYPHSIGFDITAGTAAIIAEIGPDKDLPQGPLGNLLEFGSTNNPPHNDGGRALRAEEPRFYAAMEKAIGDLL